MKRIALWILFILVYNLVRAQELTVYKSNGSVEETVSLLIKLIRAEDSLICFETVSHDMIARERGMEIPPTRSILFEDPKLTTALITCQPTAAIELPLELLVWEESEDVYIGFLDPRLMKRRFMVTDCDDTLHDLTALMIRIVTDALRQM